MAIKRKLELRGFSYTESFIAVVAVDNSQNVLCTIKMNKAETEALGLSLLSRAKLMEHA